MSDKNLRLQVVLNAVDKLTRPLKNALAGSKELASGMIRTIEAHYASPCLEGEMLGVFCRREEGRCRMAVKHADGRPAVLAQVIFG